MKTWICGLCVLSLFTLNLTAADSNWKLVWSDEFDAPGLPDGTKWAHEEGFIRNNEQQYYTRARPENARVEHGMLVLEARKEVFKNPSYDPSRSQGRWKRSQKEAAYTSASVTTQGKASWTYGRFEVRAKLPTGCGMWPAIWMLGVNIGDVGWPRCGEIDIMENVGYDPELVHGNAHTQKYNHTKKTNKGDKIEIAKPYETFHVYAVEWYADRIDYYVDDTQYFTFQNEGSGSDAWPFDRDHYLILNIAVGGSWGGQQGIDDGIFPQKMHIDYVRVYQKKSS